VLVVVLVGEGLEGVFFGAGVGFTMGMLVPSFSLSFGTGVWMSAIVVGVGVLVLVLVLVFVVAGFVPVFVC
jgi:hypothetical protein